MKHLCAAISLCLITAVPVSAQSADEGVGEGLSLLEQGAKIIMRSMLDEMEPALRELDGAAAVMGPLLKEFLGSIGDLSQYHPPEKLPNGDIILRRKSAEEMVPALPDGEIEI